MLIQIKVIPKSSCNKIILRDNVFKLKITDAPEKGKANDKVIKLLSKHFKVAKSQIEIIKGLTKPNKLIKISL
ncbi:DUF167 domain-containing protein [Patescibacteria group bacterium]|nr:DUF167 domain-containing protein [Patescibacteria group bacterium]